MKRVHAIAAAAALALSTGTFAQTTIGGCTIAPKRVAPRHR